MHKKLLKIFLDNPYLLLLGAYFFTAITSFITFQYFGVWSNEIKPYLIWPIIWIEYAFVWISQEPMLKDGIFMLILFLLFSLGIIWGLKKRRSWYGIIVLVSLMYSQIFIIFFLDMMSI